jgi:hypothetical protein
MKRATALSLMTIFFGLAFMNQTLAQNKGPMDPMSVDDWTLSLDLGPGTPIWGNGNGFGPAVKFSFEKGMWQLGPGVLTLGGEATFSFFTNRYGNNFREAWLNFIFAARSAYHYGWNIRGLDTYGGIPLGMGFSVYTHANEPGYSNNLPVYPYVGIFFGASYFFTRDLGINGELGYNSTYANIGVIYKLN